MIEKRLDTKLLYKGRFLDFVEDDIEIQGPNPIKAIRQYFVHPGGVCVVPVMDDGTVILVEQFRTPIGKVIYEIPAGKMDDGEDTLVTAQRELREETGYTAKTWIDLGYTYTCPGYSTEALHIYLAKGLIEGKQDLDHGEVVEVSKIKIHDLIDKIHEGTITDAKTIVALFLAMPYLK